MDVDKFVNYFEDIATRLKDIAHTSTSKRFTRLNIDEVLTGIRTALDLNHTCMILEAYEGDLMDNLSDNIMDNQKSAFMILRKPAKGDYTDETNTLRDCKIIGFKVLSKIKKDRETFPKSDANRLNGLIKNFDFNSVNYQKVGPLFDGCYGFRFEFSFSESVGLVYDSNDWI